MRKSLAFAIILLTLSLLLASTTKAGGTVNIYYAGSSDSQVRKALDRMGHLLTFIDDPAKAQVIVLNGIIPDDKIITQQIRTGSSGLVLFLSPDIKAEQIQILLASHDKIDLVQTDLPVSLKAIKITDPSIDTWFNQWMGEIDWITAPQIKDRFIISGAGFAPLVTGNTDSSLILGYIHVNKFGPTQHRFTFIFTPFLTNQNAQLQNWKYFDYLVNIMVAVSDRGGIGTYDEFNLAFPAPTLIPSSIIRSISMQITITGLFLFVILIIGIVLLLRKKKRSSSSGRT
jgi:hypothetical protein